jgi:TldD protein
MSIGLTPELQKLRAFLPEIIALAKRRVPYAATLVTQSGGVSVTKSKSEERVNPIPARPGIRISVWDGATFHSVATSNISNQDHLLRLTQELVNSATVRTKLIPEAGPSLDQHFESSFQEDPAKIPTSKRQEIAAHIYGFCTRYDKRIIDANTSCVFNQEYRLFCNGNRLLSSVVNRTLIFAFLFAADKGRQVMNYKAVTGTGHEAEHITDEELTEVADLTLACLSAERIQPGEYRVILDPSVAGTLAHESFGHGCELDTAMRGAARASLYVGKRVGSDLVNIVDFGGYPNKRGSIFFSDDGVLATEPVILVRNGILQPTMMTDLYSHTIMRDRLPGLKLSANGRLENWDHPIYARMTNTYFEPLPRTSGGMTKQELIEDTGEGILLDRVTSGMEDPLGWGVQIQVLLGHEIKKSRLTGKLFYQVGLTGYVPDVLMSVDGLSSELWIESVGTCGKGHKEYIRVADGGPYVRCRVKLG